MLRRAAKYFSTVPPVFLDGTLYVALSIAGLWVSILGSEQARTLIGNKALFWISSIVSSINAGLLALKMFRSTSFADHRQDIKDEKITKDKTNDEIKSF